MGFRFEKKAHPIWHLSLECLWLGAIFLCALSMADFMRYGLWMLPGLGLLFLRRWRKVLYGILALCVAVAVLRLSSFATLANRLFARSDAVQSYVYDYFPVSTTDPREALALQSLMLGAAAGLWGKWACGGLSAALGVAIAYFGISPEPVWLALLALAGAVNALSGPVRWMDGVWTVLAVAMVFLLVLWLVPEPIPEVSAWDEGIRDALAGNAAAYTQLPEPNPVPAPEPVPPPPESAQQPSRGILRAVGNLLLILLSAVTLALLFIPAVIKDRAGKRRAANRAPMEAEDHAAAIRGMYCYAQKWRALEAAPAPVPEEVENLWLEAAYSAHTLTEAQRETMARFVRISAERVWKQADWKKKLRITYQYAL